MSTYERWCEAWVELGAAPPESEVFLRIEAAYGERHRAYHTLSHIRDCFEVLDASPTQPEHRGELEVALWFHDAIYDTRVADNEAQSAEWAANTMRGVGIGETSIERTRGLVLATKHVGEPADDDEALLIDVDLSILGAPPERFDRYEEQVRREYDWVPAAAFAEARARILREFLAAPNVYHLAWFREQLEASARENLARSIERLEAG